MEANTKMLATEIKIQKAFIKLINLSGFDKLTIQKLCQEAHISRGTFYLHYIDKYDLLNHYEDEIVANISEIFKRFQKPQLNSAIQNVDKENNAFFQLFKYLYRQRDLAALLLNVNTTKIVAKVKRLIEEVLVEPRTSQSTIATQIPAAFAKEIVSQGIIDLITFWLNQEPILPPREAHQIFQQSRSLTPQQLTQIIFKEAPQGDRNEKTF